MAEKTLYAQTATGQLATLQVDLSDPEALYLALVQAGIPEAERTGVRLSDSPFASLPAAPTNSAAATAGIPIWKPTSVSDIPPQRWPKEDVIVDTAQPVELFVSFGTGYVAPHLLNTPPFTLTPAFPTGCRIRYGRHWERVYTQIVDGGISYERSVTTTSGSSMTETQTLSAELGVSVAGLSASLSASLSQAVTINKETQNTNRYTISCEPGKQAVFTIWQLMEVYTLVDSTGKPVTYSGFAELNMAMGKTRYPVSLPLNRLSNSPEIVYADNTPFSS
ncbi:MAG: hypothetical protein ACRYF0_04080 [Janthinobacterium lividum]